MSSNQDGSQAYSSVVRVVSSLASAHANGGEAWAQAQLAAARCDRLQTQAEWNRRFLRLAGRLRPLSRGDATPNALHRLAARMAAGSAWLGVAALLRRGDKPMALRMAEQAQAWDIVAADPQWELSTLLGLVSPMPEPALIERFVASAARVYGRDDRRGVEYMLREAGVIRQGFLRAFGVEPFVAADCGQE